MKEIVSLSYPSEEIAKITLRDEKTHNIFSEPLVHGIYKSIADIKPETKVVILEGYDNFFCLGGSVEKKLIKFTTNEMKFTVAGDFYRCLLDCEVPTIAAMQGHAFGGGLALGCFADFMFLAEESLYSANFMEFGFTPGMGTTFMIPNKFGENFGREMLFTGDAYTGNELKERHVPIQIFKREKVSLQAMRLAKNLSKKPLESLKILKKHLVGKIKEAMPSVIEQELKMHEISFLLPEVKEKLKKKIKEHKNIEDKTKD